MSAINLDEYIGWAMVDLDRQMIENRKKGRPDPNPCYLARITASNLN